MRERHADTVDAKVLLTQIQKELDAGGVSLHDFLNSDLTQTTAPEKLTNPGGHYRELARTLARAKRDSKMEAVLETQLRAKLALRVEDTWKPPTCCKDGKLPTGGYCSCKTGKAAAELAIYAESKKSA